MNVQILKIQAYQIAESINVRKLKAEFTAEVYFGNNSEVFYYFAENQRYIYVLNYGVIIFCNYDEVAKSEFLRYIKPFTENEVNQNIFEDYAIHIDETAKKYIIKNHSVTFGKEFSVEAVLTVMLNVGQSVALEYYENLTDAMLTSTKKHITELEHNGKFSINKKNLLKFIGKVLNVKNSIVDNLYIVDDPASAWDDDNLHYLNNKLKANFDTNSRFKDLDYRLEIVEDNLKLFTDILQHRESQWLEWIVIILILIEVVNVLVFRH
jgi:required for meiotic nuclear division protein 1